MSEVPKAGAPVPERPELGDPTEGQPEPRPPASACQPSNIADYEGYYASVFHSYFAALGLDITVEDSSSHGRLDMAVRLGGNVGLFEFKVVELAARGETPRKHRERRGARLARCDERE